MSPQSQSQNKPPASNAPDPIALTAERADPMAAFAAMMEAQRLEMESRFGFWQAGPPKGHWRFLLSLDGPRDLSLNRLVAQASWDNATAQAMACRLLGLPGAELPFWASSQGVCSMLGLRFLFAASDRMEGGWAETAGSHGEGGERLASESNTASALWMGQAHNAEAAGLIKAWAEATGGTFKVNGVEPAEIEGGWGAAIEEITAPFDWSALPKRDFRSASYRRDDAPTLVFADPASGLRPEPVMVDLRSAARVLGCPIELSVADPEHKSLLCWERIGKRLAAINAESPADFQSRFGHCLATPDESGLARLQAAQEAALIEASTAPAGGARSGPRI